MRPPSSRGPAAKAGRPLLVAATLAAIALAVLAYARGWSAPFVLDDESSVAENYSIRQLTDWRRVLSPPESSPVGGRPVANVSFAANYVFGGLNPDGYRMTNLAIHLVAALLLFGLVRRTARQRADADWLAWAIAAIWLLHPVQSATVAYVAQRTEGLMGLFYLLTLYAFVRGAQDGSRLWQGVSIAACALGMGTKEVMVTAPVVVFFYDGVFVAGGVGAAWRARWRSHLGRAATWLLLAYCMASGLHQRAVGFGLGVSPWNYALTETSALTTYLRLAGWPHPLIFDYGQFFLTSVKAAWPHVLALGAVAAAVVVATFRKSWRIGFLAAVFFVLLAPTSSFVPVATQPIAESRMYLPLACFIALAVAGVFTWVPRYARLLAGLLAVTCGILTAARMTVLREPLLLWHDTLAKRPDNARVHSNLGAALFALGRTEEAMAHEKRAIELDPSTPRVHVNYAAALLKTGRPAEALVHGETALRLAPQMTDAHYQVGVALARLGRLTEAVTHFESEIRLRPDHADAYSNLGGVLYLLGRPAEAIPQFETALRFNPGSFNARNNLASALAETGRPDAAMQLYRASLAAQPADVALRCNLALVLARTGRLDEAERELRMALEIQPGYEPAVNALAGLRQARAAQPGR